jgi:hypothetical protein
VEYLEVHHCYYDGKEPWDYEESSLVTLCRTCHRYETNNLDKSKKALLGSLSRKGWKADMFLDLAYAVESLHIARNDKDGFSAFVWAIQKPEMIKTIVEQYLFLTRKALNDFGKAGAS